MSVSIAGLSDIRCLPSSHDIAVTTEDFGEAAHDNIRVGQDIDVEKVPYSFIHYYQEVVLVCQASDAFQIRRLEQWVSRKLSEEGCKSLAAL